MTQISMSVMKALGTGALNVCVNLARLWGGRCAKGFSSAICHSGISILSHCGPRKTLMGMKCDFLLVILLRWLPASHWNMYRLLSMVWYSISAEGSVKRVGLGYFMLTKRLRARASYPAHKMCLGWRCLCGLQGNCLFLIMVLKCSLMASV